MTTALYSIIRNLIKSSFWFIFYQSNHCMISHGVSWAGLDSFMPQRRLHSENWKINHLSHTYNKSLKSDRVRSWYCILTAYHVKWNCGFRFTLLNEIIFLRWYCVIKNWFISEWNSSILCVIELTLSAIWVYISHILLRNIPIIHIERHRTSRPRNNQIYKMRIRFVNKMIWREEFKGGFFLFWVIDHT